MTLRPFSSTLQGNYRDSFQTPGAPEVIDDDIPVMAVVPIQMNFSSIGALWTDIQSHGTMLIASGSCANTTATLLTASGDGAYLSTVNLTINHVAATGGTVTLKIGTDTVFSRPCNVAQSTSLQIAFPAGREPFVPSGTTVTLVSNSTNAEGYAGITYFAA